MSIYFSEIQSKRHYISFHGPGFLIFLDFRTVDGKDGEKYPMEDMNVLNVLKLLNFW